MSKLYAGDHKKYILVLNDFFHHKQESFLEVLQSTGTSAEIILGCYICVFQPFDYLVAKSLKQGVRISLYRMGVKHVHRKWFKLVAARSGQKRNVSS